MSQMQFMYVLEYHAHANDAIPEEQLFNLSETFWGAFIVITQENT